MMSSETLGPLVETGWLEEHLDDEKLRIFDTTAFLVPQPGGTYRAESGLDQFQFSAGKSLHRVVFPLGVGPTTCHSGPFL